jgi:dTDP-4-dehydrorhamnose reductase
MLLTGHVRPGRSRTPRPARRPSKSRLCTAKLETALGKRLPEWQDNARSVVATLAAQFSS